MNTPAYYGSIGVLNAGFAGRPRRRSRIGRLLAATAGPLRIGSWHSRARSRRRLALLDARLLADIGLTEDVARAEWVKPFWRS